MEEVYRLYCYPVYAFIRRRGHARSDAQDLTQDFFIHLLEKGILAQADSQRGRFRNFLLGSLEHFLAHAAERAGAGKRGGGCQWVYLDDDAAEDRYQLAAPDGMTAEKLFEARWAAALVEATLVRLRCEMESEGKGNLFEALKGFLMGRDDSSYQQVADALNLSLGALKTAIHPPARPLSGAITRRSGAHSRHARGGRRGTSLPSGCAKWLRLQPGRPLQ